MPDKRRAIILLIALGAPLAYLGLNKLYYYILADIGLARALPQDIVTHLSENPLLLDTIFCAFLTLTTWPLYRWIRQGDSQFLPPKITQNFTPTAFLHCLIIAFGISGITALWQLFARYGLSDIELISHSIKEFDNIFDQAPSTTLTYTYSLLSIGILGPLIEEIVFRGILFSGLNRYFTAMGSAFISGAYFGIWHGSLLQSVYTAIMGIVLGLIYAATRNMYFPIATHLIINTSSTLPPPLEANEIIVSSLVILRFIAIVPAVFILHRILKENERLQVRLSRGNSSTLTDNIPSRHHETT